MSEPIRCYDCGKALDTCVCCPADRHKGHRVIDLENGKFWCATCGSGPYAEGVV